jgi:hypothetical protein
MYHFTIPMALMDFVPVAFFAVTALVLLKDLYRKMGRGAYILLSSGCVNVFLRASAKLCGSCCMRRISVILWLWSRCSCR